MAEQDTRATIDAAMEQGGVPGEVEEVAAPVASYKMFGDSRIPTSSQHGKLWQARRDASRGKRSKKFEDKAQREALDYYNNHQVPKRMDSTGNWDGSEHLARKMTRGFSQTENIVFANTSAMVPALYAKNPSIEVVQGPADELDLPVETKTLEILVDGIFSKRNAPGINLKQVMRRAVIHTTLTNVSYVLLGYTKRDASSEEAYNDLLRISDELAATDDVERIKELEGQLMGIEERYDFLRPAGPSAKFLRSDQVLRDTDSDTEDLTEDKWVMYHDYVSTSFIQAVYSTPVKEEGDEDDSENAANTEYRSIYQPSHVMSLNTGGTHNKASTAPDEIFQFSQVGLSLDF